MSRLIGLGVFMVVAMVVIQNMPDVIRYMKIRSM